MIDLGPDNAVAYLRSVGQLDPGPVRVEVLGGGVSNVVLRIEAPGRLFVLKQSRPQLRTREAWFSDLDRVYRELEVMQALGPLLPAGVVPAVLFIDRPNYAFTMSHAPREARVWKEVLLAGQVNLGLGEYVGRVLGLLHETTAGRPALVEPFGDRTAFVQLRVDPFYRRIQERCPDVADAVAALIGQVLEVREALCHGDYSPKNILVHADAFMLVDYETAHRGDPTMDLGFFLSHLMLKALRAGAGRRELFALTRSFWRGYASAAHFRPLPELAARGIGHFGLCLLARIDGTSPVDYLTAEPQRQAARRLGREVLLDRPSSWDEVLERADRIFSLL